MSLARCFDAAYPPAQPPAGAAAVLGYVGAPGFDRNLHTWTPAEWLPFQHLRQFPVVELAPWTDAIASARACVSGMRALGWSPGRALVGAMETYIVPQWWQMWEREVTQLGQWPVCYGSASTVYQNHAERYWEANYDGVPLLPGVPNVLAKQYVSGGSMDWSVVSPVLMDRGGEGPRKQ